MNKLIDYLKYIAEQELGAYHYRTLLMLLERPQTQTMVGDRLGLIKQNMNKIARDLERGGYIVVDRIEGRNKFFRVITDIEALQRTMKGQIKL